ncbi:MAG: phage major capsid protein [Desulfobacterium sp.]|nr:phage major capsid protein [Desulfobacterium sp.]
MGASVSQLEAATKNYYKLEGKKAYDLFFLHSFLFEWLFKKRKGKAYTKVPGGKRIEIPLRYDGNKAGFYTAGGILESDKREAITDVFFDPKHAYANATLLRIHLMENSSKAQIVNLLVEELEGAMNSLGKLLSQSQFDETGGAADRLTGWGACCNSDMDSKYGMYSANDIVSVDGTKVWTGNCNTDETIVSLAHIRKQKSAARYGQWRKKQPDMLCTTQEIYDYIKEILQTQQLFTGNDSGEKCKPVAAGYIGVHFEGSDINPDDFMPDNNMYYLNSDHIGAAIYPEGDFKRSPWEYIQGSGRDKTCKFFFDGNQICTNRRAQNRDSNLKIAG